MERIHRTFAELAASGETALIPFSVAGYPDYKTSLEIFLTLARSGGDIIEFGFPFSDPVADGPVIQKAASEAIRSGITMDAALDMVAAIRSETEAPIIFFSYFNPIMKYGPERLVRRARECGLDGVLVVDLPLEETSWLKPFVDAEGLAWIFLATPTTPAERVEAMCREGSGFLYYVSVTGVTGARTSLPENLASECASIRNGINLPLAVGFGVSTAQQAAWLKPHVDGVVVGSAIVSRIAEGRSPSSIGEWLGGIKSALRGNGESFE